ncbi:MAG: HlyD family efflux transporter periplasmic adaptor subunit, partial [Romboutsia sp.]
MRKIKYSNILILGIFIYIIFQILLLIIGKSTTTLSLESNNLEAKISKRGLIIRDEYLIKASDIGKLSIDIKENEKVKKSQEIAKIYKDKNIANIDKEINTLNREIEVLEEEIKKSKDKSKNLSNEIELKNLQTKKEQKEVLDNQKNKGIVNIQSDISGVLSYNFDGNEENYNLEILDSITEEDINLADNNYKNTKQNDEKVKEEDVIARIVGNNATYLAVCMNEKESVVFEVNQRVSIRLNNEKMSAKIDKMYKDDENIVIIFKISEQNVGIYDTRVEEFDIIYKQIEGLKI